jgi:hypothetical protein
MDKDVEFLVCEKMLAQYRKIEMPILVFHCTCLICVGIKL